MKKIYYRFFVRYTDTQFFLSILQTLKTKEAGCPHCKSQHIVRYGKYRERQRYKCKRCTRTFNDLTNTPFHWTHHPKKFVKFLECMLKGHSLCNAALIVKISVVTAFYWRHKLIQALAKAGKIGPLFDLDNLNWKRRYITFRSGSPIPLKPVDWPLRKTFINWMAYFDWISFKYLNRYFAWFTFLHRVPEGYTSEFERMKEFFKLTCSPRLRQTYASTRKSAIAA